MTGVREEKSRVLQLNGKSAKELMSPHPISLQTTTPIEQAIALLVSKGFRAAPVIDDAGRPVGVLSSTDLLIHQRETTTNRGAEGTRVADLMTPAVFSVRPDDTARQVVEQMIALNVHQVYVVDREGILVGVISALDVVRHLADGEVSQ